MNDYDETDSYVDLARDEIASVRELTARDQAAVRDFDFRRRVAWLTPTRDWRSDPDFYEEYSVENEDRNNV